MIQKLPSGRPQAGPEEGLSGTAPLSAPPGTDQERGSLEPGSTSGPAGRGVKASHGVKAGSPGGLGPGLPEATGRGPLHCANNEGLLVNQRDDLSVELSMSKLQTTPRATTPSLASASRGSLPQSAASQKGRQAAAGTSLSLRHEQLAGESSTVEERVCSTVTEQQCSTKEEEANKHENTGKEAPVPESKPAEAAKTSLVAPFTRQWIWQRSPFSLSVVQDTATSWHLHGSTDYGENVMDEWFVVSLLQHVTREIHSLVARVTDADGEILCIEAASVLPIWAAEPSVAEGRVYLYRGSMHLLPVAQSPATISPLPAVTPPSAIAAQVRQAVL